MAKRAVCMYKGIQIGIETIYTIVDGKQINIPERLKELRLRSRSGELFCPCGCGSNLILVASENTVREQHFRIKKGTNNDRCIAILEDKIAIQSKIILKCWLDEVLKTNDIESRVPIGLIGDTHRKYELSFISKAKKIALSYCYHKVNLSDEKFEILEAHSKDIHIIYVTDIKNGATTNQYPEKLMKIQKRQGYCLLLKVGNEYRDTIMRAVFYVQDIKGLWNGIKISEGYLYDYSITEIGDLQYKNIPMALLKEEKWSLFQSLSQNARVNDPTRKLQELVQQKKVEEQKESEKDVFNGDFFQNDTLIKDRNGNRWVKCRVCGLIAITKQFNSYGGKDSLNTGVCNNCREKEKIDIGTDDKKMKKEKIEYGNAWSCPKCGGEMKVKKGKYSEFIGCSNYPKCDYKKIIW
ncbi:MAG: topoisomerase DNA-binding C4 zinc finger domain-containing protein [Prevotella sp.]|nr:topoisomerase DNA-binding C4 zinc finger domain-containing protein [Staphylococcus sp.]MCM1349608.1 topoisomerase DNA-binding C4 zinc finger domain-containing protein [Prevotella sp.]